jgi:beta-xylosidase
LISASVEVSFFAVSINRFSFCEQVMLVKISKHEINTLKNLDFYFAYRLDGQDWQWLPQQFDASILSDEAGPAGNPNFTGAFVGMCCQDLAGTCRTADFDYFYYRERDYCANPLTGLLP